MSDKGRDRAVQLVGADISVDFIKHTLLLSASEYKQRDSAKERIFIDTHKVCSAVNCPIDDGIVPIS